MRIIDLRSDTVTLPTPEMREAMYRAEVGDDVYGEDPTINRLEEMAAERMGKEAALFVASGTMGNLVSLLIHCRRGDEVIVGDLSHTFLNEVGSAAALGGISYRLLPNLPNGMLDPQAVEAAIRTENIHHPRTKLICLENTHNFCGGVALSQAQTEAVCAVARKHNLSVHLDGARIFNAALALGVDVWELTQSVDSVMFCLSKGLSAPVGSMLCGSEEFVREARRTRKMVGGGMRQAGIIAAAGIVALEQMVDRLADDHVNARLLAEGIAGVPGLAIDLKRVQTNIVIFELVDERLSPVDFVAKLGQRGVKLLTIGDRKLRMVTHYGIERDDIEAALATVQQVMEG